MAILPYIAAKLMYHGKVSLVHSFRERVAIAELKVWQVQRSPQYPEGLKYSMFLIERETGKVIFGFDNHKPKGPHLHLGAEERDYRFRGLDALLEDFWGRVKLEGFIV